MLVEEGKIEWDAPVIALPALVPRCTIRSSPTSSPSATCWSTAAGSASAPATCSGGRRPPTTGTRSPGACASSSRRRRFRSAYAYDNVLYLVAGEVIEAVTGGSLGRLRAQPHPRQGRHDRTAMSCHSGAGAGGNVATPHAEVDGTVRPVTPFPATTPTLPADHRRAPRTWPSGSWSSSTPAEPPTAPGSSRRPAPRQIWRDVTPMPIRSGAARAGAQLQRELQRLRARSRGAGLSRAQAAPAHRRAAGLRLARSP